MSVDMIFFAGSRKSVISDEWNQSAIHLVGRIADWFSLSFLIFVFIFDFCFHFWFLFSDCPGGTGQGTAGPYVYNYRPSPVHRADGRHDRRHRTRPSGGTRLSHPAAQQQRRLLLPYKWSEKYTHLAWDSLHIIWVIFPRAEMTRFFHLEKNDR